MSNILIIEDNEQNMYLLTYLLETRGYKVAQAFDGLTGINMALANPPDLILLDIQLPNMDGYQVATALRQLEILNYTLIVAVTSYAMPGDKEKALASGANGYIEKPIDPDTFVAQLESITSLRNQP
jgi:two-component system cell cycle response regulator DivK